MAGNEALLTTCLVVISGYTDFCGAGGAENQKKSEGLLNNLKSSDQELRCARLVDYSGGLKNN